jgi:alcohol dehydrogenase class IV
MNFDFSTAGRIIFETGAFSRLPEICAGKGKNFLVVTGGSSLKKSGALKKLEEGFKAAGIRFSMARGVPGEPQVEDVDGAVAMGLENGVDAVLSIGGGSAIDTGKAASGVITNGGSVRDYLEGVGDRKLKNNPLPFIAVPTTAGTGTEATKNAVISSKKEGFKKSIRDDRLLPDIAVIDPSLTVSAPKSVTASSGMDAICQLIESYTARAHNAFCDAMALYNIPRALSAIRRAYEKPDDMEAREAMCLASLASGICLANAGLGAAHGFAAGLGVILGIPHGIACGMLLPHVMRANYERGVSRYEDIACAVYRDNNKVHDLIREVGDLNAAMGIPKDLTGFGVKPEMLNTLARASMGSSMKKNPVEFTLEDCEAFIAALI